MDFEYFGGPAIFLLIGCLVAWLVIRQTRSRPVRFSRRYLRIVDRSILLALMVGSGALAVSASFNALAFLRFRKLNPPPGEMLLVNGYRMHVNCTGSGSPTIVLDSGLGNDSLIWGAVQPQLAKTTRVCSYDRAGFGWSDAQPGPRDADHITAELHQLLLQAKVDGPIVLMGHSIAGMYIRDYAARYPEDVAGLIFIDGSTPLQDENPALQAAGETGWARQTSILMQRSVAVSGLLRVSGKCTRPIPGFDVRAGQLLAEDLCYPDFSSVGRELASFNASGHETVHAGPFGALPVLIISQDPAKPLSQKHPPRQIVELENAWNQMQEDLKKLSTHSRRIIAKGSTHAVQIDRPDLLGKEVPLFIEQIRGIAPEPTNYGSTVTE
jgi:pimeloyl-ACP methyl ester carboxylesterase